MKIVAFCLKGKTMVIDTPVSPGEPLLLRAQPSECGRQRTLNTVHAQTAAQQYSNGSYEARMSGKCGEGRD